MRPSDEELLAAFRRYIDAEEDDEYEAALQAIRELASRIYRARAGRKVRRGLKRRRAAGLQIGRPRKLTLAQAMRTIRKLGTIKAAALALGVSRRTIERLLKRDPA